MFYLVYVPGKFYQKPIICEKQHQKTRLKLHSDSHLLKHSLDLGHMILGN
jgi:hypothetical protein